VSQKPILRRCVSCRKLVDRNQLLRVIRDIQGEVVLKVGMGRSAYICFSQVCIEESWRRKKLHKALRCRIPSIIFELLQMELNQCSDLTSKARWEMSPPIGGSKKNSYPEFPETLMTTSGKIRIYELSKDLGLENKDVLDAAIKLSIAVKSHSSSISESDAKQIKNLLKAKKSPIENKKGTKASEKVILSLKKAKDTTNKDSESINKKQANQAETKDSKLQSPLKPTRPLENKIKNESEQKLQSIPPQSRQSESNKSNANLKIDRPGLPKKPLPPLEVIQAKKPSLPLRPNDLVKGQKISPGNSVPNQKITSRPVPRPQIISKSQSPSQREDIGGNSKSKLQNPTNKPNSKPQLVGRPQPKRPIAPPNRPENSRSDKRRQGLQIRNSGPNSSQRNNFPQRAGSPQQRTNTPPNRPSSNNRPSSGRSANSNRPGQPRRPGNPVELVGKPIRRDKTGNNPPNRNNSNNRNGNPNRNSMPSGMRKPVAPGELMQLQKPNGRPGPNGPQRHGSNTKQDSKGAPGGSKPTESRLNQAPAPKRPSHRPGTGAGAPRRTGRPDWDDSAKLEALRSKSPQKQRQKVHIIGENDEQLTTETSGFAGEQQAVLLSASLARPSKPKSSKKSSGKPMAAIRKRKKETTRQRQRRRAMELRAAREAKQVRPEMIIVPEANLTVQELADKLSVESSEIIKSLFFKGITATVTQTLDISTIETVAEEFGVPVLQDDVEEAARKTAEMIEDTDLKHLIRRPPVVTVMGHVDHGKTSLLDAIRKARVAAGEAGGITQHIGAYQVEVEHAGEPRKLTFLDTPGHEAFTAMRARGTKVTDVAVLVVAADDGVRPQTLEAISHARAAEVPIVVAINKIDKEGASSDRVKQELSEQSLLAEEWGGEVVMVPVSAIKGENIDKLLEMILLVTEVEELQANPDRLAKGTVIEAHLDKAKGPVATLLVQNGTLRTGDVIAAGPVLGRVRAMVNDNGSRLKESGPSSAVEALGFSEVPTAGDEFEAYKDEKSARAVVGDRATDARATRLAQQMASKRVSLSAISGQASEGDLKELNLILKADVQGSVEAILGSLEQLPKDEVQVRVLLSAPGEITETDVDLAAASGAVIVGFNTSMASGAKKAADANSVDVRDYEVIYKLLEDIQLAMEGLLEPEMVEENLGQAEVRAIFSVGKSAVAGCYITNGKLQRNCRVRVKRSDQIVFEGDLDSLRRNKDDVKDVATGFECGIGCDRFSNWEEGDIIEAYKLVTQRRKLNN